MPFRKHGLMDNLSAHTDMLLTLVLVNLGRLATLALVP